MLTVTDVSELVLQSFLLCSDSRTDVTFSIVCCLVLGLIQSCCTLVLGLIQSFLLYVGSQTDVKFLVVIWFSSWATESFLLCVVSHDTTKAFTVRRFLDYCKVIYCTLVLDLL